MICTECGTNLQEHTLVCPNCGAPVAANNYNPNQQQAPYYNPNQQPYGQNAYGPNSGAPYYQNPNDVPSCGLNGLSFLIPLVGLILYLTGKDSTPVKAKACGKYALIGFIVSIVLSIISVVLVSVFAVVAEEILW